jgi:probable phosphoglycerate mutase
VSHGGVIKALYIHAEGHMPPGRVQNTSLNVFHISATNEWTLRSWGDVNHLQNVEFLRSGTGGDELQ